MTFWEIFLTLTDNKHIFENSKSISADRAPFFSKATKKIWLAVLCSNYLFYDFNATSIQKDFKSFWIFSHYWFLLKSYYIMLILISPIGLQKTLIVWWIWFSEKSFGLNGFDTFFSHFSADFLVFVYICFFFVVIRVINMSYWSLIHEIYLYPKIEAYASVDFRWKLSNSMAVKNLKTFFSETFLKTT